MRQIQVGLQRLLDLGGQGFVALFRPKQGFTRLRDGRRQLGQTADLFGALVDGIDAANGQNPHPLPRAAGDADAIALEPGAAVVGEGIGRRAWIETSVQAQQELPEGALGVRGGAQLA
jgi:hypothetical protein